MCQQKIKEGRKEDDPTVVKTKSVCLMHSEAKQTKMSESGAEKGLLQGQARRTGGLYSKTQTPQSPSTRGF